MERWIRTLRGLIWHHNAVNNTLRYVDALPQIVKSYNNRKHRTLQRSPASVTPENSADLYRTLYGDPADPMTYRLKKVGYKFKEGDTVRVRLRKGAFVKSYVQSFSSEIYRVSQRLQNQRPVAYHLETLMGDPVKGKFYEPEMVHATYDPSKEYPIESIIARETRNGVPYVKVRWVGWLDPSWIRQSDIIDLASSKKAKRKGSNKMGKAIYH